MRILVLGSSGMAGHVVAIYLEEQGHEVSTISAKNKLNDQTALIDVTNNGSLKQYLDSQEFDVVVNCIGLLVNESEQRKDLAVYINSYLPLYLHQYYKETPSRIIHISTNGVFSFTNPPYYETSRADAVSFYGKTKALGEINSEKDLTIRLSIVGPDLKPDAQGLFNWFMLQKNKVTGFNKVMWNGITTIELAKFIQAVLANKVSGVYHLAPAIGVSKYDLLRLFAQVFQSPAEIRATSDSVADQTIRNTRKDFVYEIPDYPTMVTEMKKWIENHAEIYPHYTQ